MPLFFCLFFGPIKQDPLNASATAAPLEEELIAKIALQLVPRIGNKIAHELVAHYGSADNLFAQATVKELCQFTHLGPTTAQAIVNKSTWQRAEEEWAFAQKYHIQVLSQTEKDYPKRLQQCPDAPFLLYYRGNAPLNASKVVALVGTRKPSARGRHFCEHLLEELQGYSPLIVSGLAYGIDITAHRKSLALQLPNIGVVAHGLDRIYPSQHQPTAQKMVRCGGILTEFRTQTEPLSKHFPHAKPHYRRYGRCRSGRGNRQSWWVDDYRPLGQRVQQRSICRARPPQRSFSQRL